MACIWRVIDGIAFWELRGCRKSEFRVCPRMSSRYVLAKHQISSHGNGDFSLLRHFRKNPYIKSLHRAVIHKLLLSDLKKNEFGAWNRCSNAHSPKIRVLGNWWKIVFVNTSIRSQLHPAQVPVGPHRSLLSESPNKHFKHTILVSQICPRRRGQARTHYLTITSPLVMFFINFETICLWKLNKQFNFSENQ